MKVRPIKPYLCPICHAPIDRLDLKTCGASDCLQKWRSLLSSERTNLQVQAAQIALELLQETLPPEMPNLFPQINKEPK